MTTTQDDTLLECYRPRDPWGFLAAWQRLEAVCGLADEGWAWSEVCARNGEPFLIREMKDASVDVVYARVEEDDLGEHCFTLHVSAPGDDRGREIRCPNDWSFELALRSVVTALQTAAVA